MAWHTEDHEQAARDERVLEVQHAHGRAELERARDRRQRALVEHAVAHREVLERAHQTQHARARHPAAGAHARVAPDEQVRARLVVLERLEHADRRLRSHSHSQVQLE